MRWFPVILALAGCDKVWLTENPIEPDAAPDAPANGHDEDQDGIADVTDNCPHRKGSQIDSDKDGVGDLCDPNPGPFDTIARFYSFDAANADFISVSGSWTVTKDTLVHKGNTNTSDFWKYVARNGLALRPPYVIDVRFKIDVAFDGSELSISTGLDTSDFGSFCTMKFYDTHTEIHAFNPGDDQRADRMPPLDRAATFTVRLTATSTSLNCVVSSSLEGDTSATSTLRVGVGPAGFESRNLDATIDYMVIYTPKP